MNTNRIMRSKIYRFLDYLLRLIILNALVVVPSFSFFIIYASLSKEFNSNYTLLLLIPVLLFLFPSVVACFDVIKQYENNETNTIFKDFFKSLKKHYLKSLIMTMVILTIGYLLINSILFFYNYAANGLIYILGLIFSVSFTFLSLMILVHICLVMVYFPKLQFIEICKLACIMAFKDILTTLIIMIIWIVIMSLNIAIYIVLIICGISLPVFLTIKLSFREYIKIYGKVGKND